MIDFSTIYNTPTYFLRINGVFNIEILAGIVKGIKYVEGNIFLYIVHGKNSYEVKIENTFQTAELLVEALKIPDLKRVVEINKELLK